jgi:G3E family GTPase
VTVIETEFAINFSLEEDLADSSSSAVRVYEFGSNACVCCSSSGEFKAAVASFVKDDSSSLLVVELTGTARVEFVSRSLLLSGLVVLVVCVLDTLFFESQPEELVRSCLVAADVVVLSKTDESTPQRVNEARQLALRLSPAAMVISSSLKEPADIDFGFCRKKSDDSSSDLVAAHTTSLSWSCASRDGPVDPQLFGLLLEGFLKDHKEVMRCKGVLFPESARPVCLLQGVFDRVQVSTASRMSREGNDSSRVSLVCDANHAEKLVVDVQRLLEAAAVIQHSPDVVVRIIDDQLIESVIECEQQVRLLFLASCELNKMFFLCCSGLCSRTHLFVSSRRSASRHDVLAGRVVRLSFCFVLFCFVCLLYK